MFINLLIKALSGAVIMKTTRGAEKTIDFRNIFVMDITDNLIVKLFEKIKTQTDKFVELMSFEDSDEI